MNTLDFNLIKSDIDADNIQIAFDKIELELKKEYDLRLLFCKTYCQFRLSTNRDLNGHLDELYSQIKKCKVDSSDKKHILYIRNSYSWLLNSIKSNLEFDLKEKTIVKFDTDEIIESIKVLTNYIIEEYNISIDNSSEDLTKVLKLYKKPNIEPGKQVEIKNISKETVEEKAILQLPKSEGSEKWRTLQDKIKIFTDLLKNQKVLEAAIFFRDINNLIKKFDPKEYFPEIFFPFYESMTENFDKVVEVLDKHKKTLQWHIVEQMYKTDYRTLATKEEFFNSAKTGIYNPMSLNADNRISFLDKDGAISKIFYEEDASYDSNEVNDSADDIEIGVHENNSQSLTGGSYSSTDEDEINFSKFE